MPVEGFDDASKNISKRGTARRKASREASSKKIGAIQTAREAEKAKKKAKRNQFNKYATPTEKRQSGRSGVNKDAIIARGRAAEAAKKSPTTQETLLNIKNEYTGFDPFGEVNLSPYKRANITETETPKVEEPSKVVSARPKAKAIKTAVSGVKIAKTMPSNKLVAAAPVSTASTEEYQKKGTMGKKKAPKIKAKAARRKQKGSRAATLKKGFGY